MDLYALPPEDFTAARDAAVKQARAAGDKAAAGGLAALRRPTVSAHAVNALVRAEPELVDQLLELGGRLAEAQSAGHGEALRELGAQRRQLVEAVTDRAAAATGRPLPAAARAEVVATVEAALADPASAEAVRSGRLVRALSFAGFGGVDLTGAVADGPAVGLGGGGGSSSAATPVPGARGSAAGADRQPGDGAGAGTRAAAERAARRDEAARRAERERRVADARAAALAASGALDDAVRAAECAEQDRRTADAQAEAALERVAAAEQALAQARQDRDDAQAGTRRAARDLDRAHAAVTAAQHAAERARAALTRLDDPSRA